MNIPGLVKKTTEKLTDKSSVDLMASAQDQALVETSDEQLMLAYASGDKHAFDQLYARYRQSLYRFMQRQITIQGAILDELYQDVWLKLIKARDNYKVDASFKTFLFQIALNTVRDYFRRESVRHIMDAIDDDSQVEDRSEKPDAVLEAKQIRQAFITALDQMPAEQKEIFLLREEAGLTSVQIAEMLQLNVDTVKSRMRYAITRLKKTLNKGDV